MIKALHGASVRRQRWVLLTALVILACGVALVPLRSDMITAKGQRLNPDAAQAAPSTWPCGQDDRNNFGYRLQLDNLSYVEPCLSGATLQVRTTGARNGTKFTIAKARYANGKNGGTGQTLKYLGKSKESNLVHLTFENFRILKQMELTVEKDWRGNALPYKVTIKPDSFVQVGGNNVTADFWVTPSSEFCVSVIIEICRKADDLGGLIGAIAAGSTFNGTYMDLQVRYMTVSGSGGAYPVQMPDTTIEMN